MTEKTWDKLYHLDKKGKTRVWYVVQKGDKYQTISGINDGKLVTTKWMQALPKNEGKVNATNGEEQATLEIESMYRLKIKSKYSTDINNLSYRNYLQPMLAAPKYERKTIEKYPGKRIAIQPKLDGIRSVFSHDETGKSRTGETFFTTEHIEDDVNKVLKKYNVTLDGELYNHEYHDRFEELTSLINTKKVENLSTEDFQKIRDVVQLHAYDVIVHGEPEMPFEERYDILNAIISMENLKFVHLVKTEFFDVDDLSDEDIMDMHNVEIANNYEGLIIRNPSAKYHHARTKDLLKVKVFDEEEMIIEDIIEGTGDWSGAAKSVLLRTPIGTQSSSGIAGTYKAGVKLLEDRSLLIGTEATVRYQGYTKDEALRFGVVKKFHYGKRTN